MHPKPPCCPSVSVNLPTRAFTRLGPVYAVSSAWALLLSPIRLAFATSWSPSLFDPASPLWVVPLWLRPLGVLGSSGSGPAVEVVLTQGASVWVGFVRGVWALVVRSLQISGQCCNVLAVGRILHPSKSVCILISGVVVGNRTEFSRYFQDISPRSRKSNERVLGSEYVETDHHFSFI